MQPGDDAGPGTDTRGLIVADEIDPVQFGRLLASVDQLTETLGETQEAMQALNARIVELESRYAFGKAALTGLIIGAGFAVKGLWETLTGLIK